MLSLLVTVTVECDTPRGELQARTSLRNLDGLQRLQRLCDRFGVPPTYLLNYPAASRPEAEQFARAWDEDRCEVGAHLQPWSTPPFEANEDRLTPSPPSAIPASAVAGKLAALTQVIEERFGKRPRSHRAGRHGLNGASLQALERLGYTIDSSACPFTDLRADGATDWRQAPESPYFPDRQDPTRRGSSPILEVPLTVGAGRELPSPVARGLSKMPSAVQTVLTGPRSPLQRRVRLDPVSATPAELRHLAERIAARGLPCLNVSLRSNELWPGESAANPTAHDVDRTFEALDDFMRLAVDGLRATPRTLTRFAHHYLSDCGVS
jgi:hypothetical protein